MNIVEAGTKAIGAISGFGAGCIISDIACAVKPENLSMVGRVARSLGAFALGGLVGTAAEQYSRGAIESSIDFCKSVKTIFTKQGANTEEPDNHQEEESSEEENMEMISYIVNSDHLTKEEKLEQIAEIIQ